MKPKKDTKIVSHQEHEEHKDHQDGFGISLRRRGVYLFCI